MNFKNRDTVDWIACAIGITVAVLIRFGFIHKIGF